MRYGLTQIRINLNRDWARFQLPHILDILLQSGNSNLKASDNSSAVIDVIQLRDQGSSLAKISI